MYIGGVRAPPNRRYNAKQLKEVILGRNHGA